MCNLHCARTVRQRMMRVMTRKKENKFMCALWWQLGPILSTMKEDTFSEFMVHQIYHLHRLNRLNKFRIPKIAHAAFARDFITVISRNLIFSERGKRPWVGVVSEQTRNYGFARSSLSLLPRISLTSNLSHHSYGWINWEINWEMNICMFVSVVSKIMDSRPFIVHGASIDWSTELSS